MADGTSHPFYTIAIADDVIVQAAKQLSHEQQDYHHKDLIDLLSWNNTISHSLNSTDSSLSITSHSVSDGDFNRLKNLIRKVKWPIDHRIRRQLWMNILTLNRVSSSKQNRHGHQASEIVLSPTSMIIDNNNLTSLSSKYNSWPNFVDTTNLCFYYLNESTGQLLLQRILSTFALHHPDVTYCPTLEPFSALLLHYHNEYEVLYLINRLLIKKWLCGETRLQWEANCNVFKKLLRVYYVR
jgi:hypothetical protein